ncbi:MAG: DUF1304 domain-containing protein [Bdellovibrionota bacterium]
MTPLYLIAIARTAILISGLIHIYIFYVESITWGKPSTNKAFGIRNPADAETTRQFAFNQGFYNLFLALGIFAGFALSRMGHSVAAETLFTFCALSIAGAGIVLFFSAKLIRPAIMQAGPPLLYLILTWFF